MTCTPISGQDDNTVATGAKAMAINSIIISVEYLCERYGATYVS
jgi:hypothetical protein